MKGAREQEMLSTWPFGPLYDRYWRRRLALVFVGSFIMWAVLMGIGVMASDGQATVDSVIIGFIMIYIVQVAAGLFVAFSFMPREMKEEWRHRQFKARVHRSPRR